MPLSTWAVGGITLLLLGCIINFVLVIILYNKMKRFEASSITMQTFTSGRHLDTILMDIQEKMVKQNQEANGLDARLSRAETKMRAGVDRVEAMRFKAFENEGSDLSFTCAFLNQEGAGVVLTSINNRDGSRVYAKPLKDCQSEYPLTKEETEVIGRASRGHQV